jgi:soluble lytic murein transglycosylase-like protein
VGRDPGDSEGLRPSERWTSLITYWADRAAVPADLCFRQMMAESAGNPRAVSPAGAMGLFQIMPGTYADLARELMLGQDPMNPDDNIHAGTHYDAKCLASVRLWLDEFVIPEEDHYRLMLCSYNAGGGYVCVAIKESRARGLVPTWTNFASLFPQATVRGLKPDWKQALGYATKILPLT